jgi:acyl dehydratase
MTLKGVRRTYPIVELEKLVGAELGLSDWVEIDQDRIDLFADATLDYQYIHVDPETAKAGPFGSTVAHGFLTLSLIAHLLAKMRFLPDNTTVALNYGLDRVRFVQPVRCGERVRLRCCLLGLEEKEPGKYLLRIDCKVEVEGTEAIAMSAEMLVMTFVDG